ncbi:hypothetical protein [uncultured Friedmanniella sp.]|uniref:hypothetical protein n=1 Tax=uncultured Friedmanniella sp. TaxID=335381 RepID=UPI0035C998CF
MTEPDPEPEASRQLDESKELIEEARSAAGAALPDTQSADDLDAPSTERGLPDDEPVTPGPN